jgi:hypothetical protein
VRATLPHRRGPPADSALPMTLPQHVTPKGLGMTDLARQTTIGPVRAAIILLTLITAGIHGYLGTRAPGLLGNAFLLDAVVYVLLLAALLAPGPEALRRARPTTRVLLLLWAVATLLAWLVSGRGRNPLGYLDKLVEMALVVLLGLDVAQARRQG